MFFYCYISRKSLSANYKLINHQIKGKSIKFAFIIFILFFSHSLQCYNERTSTLNISNPSEFTNLNDYQNNVNHIIISKGIMTIPNCSFYKWNKVINVLIDDTVTSIGSYAFYECTKLENVSFGEGITYIGECAFQTCSKLKHITFKSNLTTIGQNVFLGCARLESVYLNEGVKTIGPFMFKNCNLADVAIPSTVSSIFTNPFHCCNNLKFIKISKKNQYFSNYENDGVLYDKNITKLISYPNGNATETFKIPDSVTSIENNAFNSCTNLSSISFGNRVSIIKDSSFISCAFTSIVIPNSVKLIQSSGFRYCEHLETVFIGKNVTYIGANTFGHCTSLKCVYFYGKTSPTIDINSFSETSVTSIMVSESYQGEKFGKFNITKGTLDKCLPMPTQTFEQSSIFTASNVFSESITYSSKSLPYSDTFSQSSLITELNPISHISNSYVLTYILSITYTISIHNSFITNSFIISKINSLYTYSLTRYIWYDYTTIIYSTYYQFYTYLISLSNCNNKQNNISTKVLIGAVCAPAGIIFIIIGFFLIFLYKKNNKQSTKSSTYIAVKNEPHEQHIEFIDEEIKNYALKEEDQWI